jgi:YHS domain-containing protein
MKKVMFAICIFVSYKTIAIQQEPKKEKTEVLEKNGTDPVCKMTVNKGTKMVSTHKGKQYGFCGKMCKETFEKHPEKFTKK